MIINIVGVMVVCCFWLYWWMFFVFYVREVYVLLELWCILDEICIVGGGGVGYFDGENVYIGEFSLSNWWFLVWGNGDVIIRLIKYMFNIYCDFILDWEWFLYVSVWNF